MPRTFTHRPTKTLIVGESGFGKSQYQLRAALGSEHRLKLVFDHKSEFRSLAGSLQVRTPEEIDAAMSSGWVVFDPHHMFPGKLVEAFRFFCDFAWNAAEAVGFTKLLVADELKLLTEGGANQELCRVMEDGRSVGLDVLFTSHNANGLHNRIRGQFTEIVSFFQKTKPALEVMESEFCFDPAIIGRLERGEFVAQNLDSGRFSGGRVF